MFTGKKVIRLLEQLKTTPLGNEVYDKSFNALKIVGDWNLGNFAAAFGDTLSLLLSNNTHKYVSKPNTDYKEAPYQCEDSHEQEFMNIFLLVKALNEAQCFTPHTQQALDAVVSRDHIKHWEWFVQTIVLLHKQKYSAFNETVLLIGGNISQLNYAPRAWKVIFEFLNTLSESKEEPLKKEDWLLVLAFPESMDGSAAARTFAELRKTGILNNPPFRRILEKHMSLRADFNEMGQILLALHRHGLLNDPEIFNDLQNRTLENLKVLYTIFQLPDAKTEELKIVLKKIRVVVFHSFERLGRVINQLKKKKLFKLENMTKILDSFIHGNFPEERLCSVNTQGELDLLLAELIVEKHRKELELFQLPQGKLAEILIDIKIKYSPDFYNLLVNEFLHAVMHLRCGVELVDILLKEKADIQYKRPNGKTIWHTAARTSNVSVMERLLKETKDQNVFNLQDESGRTPLMESTVNCHNQADHNGKERSVYSMLNYMLERSLGKVSIQDNQGNTVLHLLDKHISTMEDAETLVQKILKQDEKIIHVENKRKLLPIDTAFDRNFFTAAALLKKQGTEPLATAIVTKLITESSDNSITMLILLRFAFPKLLGQPNILRILKHFEDRQIRGRALAQMDSIDADYFDFSMRYRLNRDVLWELGSKQRLSYMPETDYPIGENLFPELKAADIPVVFSELAMPKSQCELADKLHQTFPDLALYDQAWEKLRSMVHFINLEGLKKRFQHNILFLFNRGVSVCKADIAYFLEDQAWVDGLSARQIDYAMYRITDHTQEMKKWVDARAKSFSLSSVVELADHKDHDSVLITTWNLLRKRYQEKDPLSPALLIYFVHILYKIHQANYNGAIEAAIACLSNCFDPNSDSGIKSNLLKLLQVDDPEYTWAQGKCCRWIVRQITYGAKRTMSNLEKERGLFLEVLKADKSAIEAYHELGKKSLSDVEVFELNKLIKILNANEFAPARKLAAPGALGLLPGPANSAPVHASSNASAPQVRT